MSNSKSVKLLVVDEQVTYCDLIKEHIDICSHQFDIVCECVNSGTEALEKIAEWEPSVILLDAHLQDVNSFAVLDACRDALAQMPSHGVKAAVVVCSGNGKNFQLTNCAEIFRVIRLAVHESTYLVFGVVSAPTLVDAMRVSWLAGVRDS